MPSIALLTGGTSTERDVSLASARYVQSLLESFGNVRVYDLPKEVDGFLLERRAHDVAIPLIHGRGGEDGCLQGLLETLSIPYLFSRVSAHAIAIDKALAKTLVGAKGVPVKTSTLVRQGDAFFYTEPVVIKPCDGGSSIGVACARSQQEVDAALMKTFLQATTALIEPWITGNEYTVAVIDEAPHAKALPVVHIQPPANRFFDYQTKYDPTCLAKETCPALIEPSLRLRLQEFAMTVHVLLGCRHVSRSDFIVDAEGNAWFLEVNTIPGMTPTSLLPKALAAHGSSLQEQLIHWIRTSVEEQRAS